MKKITIERSKWRCGGTNSYEEGVHGLDDTRLLNSQGFSCCLGFAAKQLGNLHDDDLREVNHPGNLGVLIEPLNERHAYHKFCSTEFSSVAIRINDGPALNREDREARLLELFAKNNLELEFTGNYND